jgi:hypothetical protein
MFRTFPGAVFSYENACSRPASDAVSNCLFLKISIYLYILFRYMENRERKPEILDYSNISSFNEPRAG